MIVEAQRYQYYIDDEEHYIEKKKYSAKGSKSSKTERYCSNLGQYFICQKMELLGHLLPVNSTFAIPPVAIVILKKVQVKCRILSRNPSVPGSDVWGVSSLRLSCCAPRNADRGISTLELLMGPLP